ncbi:MAG: thioredoxin family protein [Loktanella sp.]|nr:thioredoxin family protein [Loktanella sp.]
MLRFLIPIAALFFWATPSIAEIGDDGLHDAPFLKETFKDLAEDAAEAAANGQQLMVIIEQRGCIYCKRMHEEVFVDPRISRMLADDFFVVQINMFGGIEVTDFDGTAQSEAEMVESWGFRFTPTMMMFDSDEVGDGKAPEVAMTVIPGALDVADMLTTLQWAQSDAAAQGVSLTDYQGDK